MNKEYKINADKSGYNSEHLTYFGRGFFDNEQDARKGFG